MKKRDDVLKIAQVNVAIKRSYKIYPPDYISNRLEQECVGRQSYTRPINPSLKLATNYNKKETLTVIKKIKIK